MLNATESINPIVKFKIYQFCFCISLFFIIFCSYRQMISEFAAVLFHLYAFFFDIHIVLLHRWANNTKLFEFACLCSFFPWYFFFFSVLPRFLFKISSQIICCKLKVQHKNTISIKYYLNGLFNYYWMQSFSQSSYRTYSFSCSIEIATGLKLFIRRC